MDLKSYFRFPMYEFSDPHITLATKQDMPELLVLLNGSYRGEYSKKGWTTEADLIEGNTRIDENGLSLVLEKPGSVLLKYTDEDDGIIACVNLQKHNGRIYLGLLGVSPNHQDHGIGKHLLQASEEYARQENCRSIYMSVITLRSELIYWYFRHGYQDTGERKPFHEDSVSGKHARPLEFMILQKQL